VGHEELPSCPGRTLKAKVPAVPASGWIAGLNHGSHDTACALVHDGELVAVVEQERLSQVKRAPWQSPVDALQCSLQMAGIRFDELACVALGSDHSVLAGWLGHTEEASRFVDLGSPDRLFPAEIFGDSADAPELVSFRHHLAHAASAFWPSGFDEAAILVMDAMGEDASTALAYGNDEGIEILDTYPIELSLGFFYEAATAFVGFHKDDAGKLMGLAPYGKATQPMPLRSGRSGLSWDSLPPPVSTGREMIHEQREALWNYFEANCFPYERGTLDEVMAYADFAASVQASLESAVLELASTLRRKTNSRRIVLAGGVALNCTANGKLWASRIFDEMFVQPLAHDAGVALGAALLASHTRNGDTVRGELMRHAYWGPSFTSREIEQALAERSASYTRLSEQELMPRVARIIADGGIVAWHQYRAEVGPRALGSRSLLGDPRKRSTLAKLNYAKQREMWRPVAPSVLEERFDEYFVGQKNAFMIVAATVRPEVRPRIPAVVHVDGSARPQVVRSSDNPRYALLLEEFDRLTGVPVIVNTSLNQKGAPIVNAPSEALDFLFSREIDALAIGDYLVTR
jgi:carbamoyltransferase